MLASFGHAEATVDEVLAYCANPFDLTKAAGVRFPLDDEPHVADWRRYQSEGGAGLFDYLQQRVPQFAIPIADGISSSEAYGNVIRKGRAFREADFPGRLRLEAPSALELQIHEHPMGALPVLIAGTRGDFETLSRALGNRHEPMPVNPSVNAAMITGLVNWDRVNKYRAEWSAKLDPFTADNTWPDEMGRVAKATPGLFFDRLILVTRAPYGGRSAGELGIEMDDAAWQSASTALRIEHEFAHYATKRIYGTMRLNLLGELIADAMGMTHALGSFRARWFLGALGLGQWPALPETARAHTYRSNLSDEGMRLACDVCGRAATALEQMPAPGPGVASRARYLIALSALTLDVLATADARPAFDEAWTWAGTVTGPDA